MDQPASNVTKSSHMDFSKVKPGVLAEVYVRLRDQRREKEAEVDAIKAKMTVISKAIMNMLADAKQESFSSYGHTIYTYKRTYTSVNDRLKFLKHIMENDAWELLDVGANATETEKYAAANDSNPPPGVTMNKIVMLGCQKASKKK